MARKGRFNLRKVTVNTELAAGALATKDVVEGAMTFAPSNPYRCISIDLSWSWEDVQAAIDDGCDFGVAHSDYTAAEIEEALEAVGSIDIGDKLAQEKANRLVRSIGTIEKNATGLSGSFNDGKKLKTRLNWAMGISDVVNIWIRNASGTVWTTGSSLSVAGEMWIKDGF